VIKQPNKKYFPNFRTHPDTNKHLYPEEKSPTEPKFLISKILLQISRPKTFSQTQTYNFFQFSILIPTEKKKFQKESKTKEEEEEERMSGSTSSKVPTTKLHDKAPNDTDTTAAGKKDAEKQPATLEEDDEFEDFPVEGMFLFLLSSLFFSLSLALYVYMLGILVTWCFIIMRYNSLQNSYVYIYIYTWILKKKKKRIKLTDIFVSLDWSLEDTEVPGNNTHLWEESWDDDDENEDFSKQLK
jgi:hypothetical protein